MIQDAITQMKEEISSKGAEGSESAPAPAAAEKADSGTQPGPDLNVNPDHPPVYTPTNRQRPPSPTPTYHTTASRAPTYRSSTSPSFLSSRVPRFRSLLPEPSGPTPALPLRPRSLLIFARTPRCAYQPLNRSLKRCSAPVRAGSAHCDAHACAAGVLPGSAGGACPAPRRDLDVSPHHGAVPSPYCAAHACAFGPVNPVYPCWKGSGCAKPRRGLVTGKLEGTESPYCEDHACTTPGCLKRKCATEKEKCPRCKCRWRGKDGALVAGHHERFYCNAHVCVIQSSPFGADAYGVCGLRQEKGAEPPWCRAHACAGCDFLADGTGTGKASGSCTWCACTMDGCRRRRVKKGRKQTEKWDGHVRCPTTDYERRDPQWHPEHKAERQKKKMDWGPEAATTCAAHTCRAQFCPLETHPRDARAIWCIRHKCRVRGCGNGVGWRAKRPEGERVPFRERVAESGPGQLWSGTCEAHSYMMCAMPRCPVWRVTRPGDRPVGRYCAYHACDEGGGRCDSGPDGAGTCALREEGACARWRCDRYLCKKEVQGVRDDVAGTELPRRWCLTCCRQKYRRRHLREPTALEEGEFNSPVGK